MASTCVEDASESMLMILASKRYKPDSVPVTKLKSVIQISCSQSDIRLTSDLKLPSDFMGSHFFMH